MDTEAVSHEVAVEAANNVAAHFGYRAIGGHVKFWHFLGLDYEEAIKTFLGRDQAWTLPRKIALRIRSLAGPHHQTMIKVMEANGAKLKEDCE